MSYSLQNNTASAGMTRRNTYVCSDRNNTDRLSVIPNGKENRWERMFVVFDLVSSWKNTKTCISTEKNLGLSQWTENTQRRSFPFCSRAFLVRLLSHIFGGTCFETHCLFFIVLPSVSAFLRQFFTYKCSFRPTRMEHSSLWTQMWPNSKLVNINIYKTISVSRPHSNSLLFYCWKKIQTESEEKISVVSSRYFLSFYSFFSFLVSIYVPSFFFLIIFIFHFYLFVCGFGRWVGCFFAVAWPAWLRWLVPLAPLLPLRPLRSVPRPVRCGWGIKPSARCTLARQAGPRCPTPTTLWTTARPSKTAGPPNLPPCLSPLMSQPLFGPFANPHIQPASHSVTPQLNHGHHFLQTSARRV